MMRRLLPGKSNLLDASEEAKRLAQGWFTDTKAESEVMAVLKRHDLTTDAIDAEACTDSAPKLQVIDGFLGIAMVRRDAALREIERRRETVALVDKSCPN